MAARRQTDSTERQARGGRGARVPRAHAELLDSISVMAFVTDAAGEPIYFNPVWVAFTGCDPGDDEACTWDAFVAEDDLPALRRLLDAALTSPDGGEGDLQIRGADGRLRWASCFVSRYRGDGEAVAGLVGMCTDVTARRHREEQLAFMATHDSLTGLPNRRVFETSLARAVQRARRGTTSSLLMLDVDRFKAYNDGLGHLEGDQALVNFALLLQRHVRAGDLLARIGGDEFGVLLEGTSIEEAQGIAERMRASASAEEFVARAREFGLTMSGGIVLVDGSLDARAVFDLADTAMYAAKEEGRNRVLTISAARGLPGQAGELAERVREAVSERRFVLHYQPVIDLRDDTVAYYESLLRMTGPGGLLLPADFLPTVERLGLSSRLSRIVVGIALESLARHPLARVAINLSAPDLADASFPRFIDEEMHRLAIEPSRLVIELSESAVMGNMASARGWMDRLGRRGVTFVLDDFGSGLGLFGVLKDLPFSQVKIDGSLITALANNGRNAAFVEAVRSLIESQGRTAVASWVESAELLARVRSAGFDLGQGYHLEVPTADLDGLIAHYT